MSRLFLKGIQSLRTPLVLMSKQQKSLKKAAGHHCHTTTIRQDFCQAIHQILFSSKMCLIQPCQGLEAKVLTNKDERRCLKPLIAVIRPVRDRYSSKISPRHEQHRIFSQLKSMLVWMWQSVTFRF